MRQYERAILCRYFSVAVLLLMSTELACCPTEKPARRGRARKVTQADVHVPDAVPPKLVAVMGQAFEEANKWADGSVTGRSGTSSVDEISRQVFTGVKAADKILAHPDADKKQKKS